MSDTYERIARASELMNLATSASELMNLALTMSTGLDEVSKKESRLLDHWTFAPKYVRGKLGVTRMSFTTGIGGSTRPTRFDISSESQFHLRATERDGGTMDEEILERIVEAPVFGSDGVLQTDPGYHAGSLYIPRPGFCLSQVEHVDDGDRSALLSFMFCELLYCTQYRSYIGFDS